MFAIGRRHLEWGSADQPPLAPAPAGLADGIAPGSLIALRLPAVLAPACAVMVAGVPRAAAGAARPHSGVR